MKAKNNKRILSLILSFLMLVSLFSMVIPVAVADTDVLLDNTDNSFVNWSDSIAADGTLQDGVAGNIFTVNDGVWPAGKTVQTVTWDLNATVKGASTSYVAITYYYEDDENYKLFLVRESGAGVLYVGFADVVDGVFTEVDTDKFAFTQTHAGMLQINTDKGIYANIGGNTGLSVDLTAAAKISVSYINSSTVNFAVTSADGSVSYANAVTATDSATDFKSPEKQKVHLFVANQNNVAYQTNSIQINFEKDLTVTGSSITDNASNAFEHFSSFVSTDGSVTAKGTPFSTNDGVWPAEKQLKKVDFDLAVQMSGDASKYMRLIYHYTDANNYKTLEVRESGGKALYMAFVDVVGGEATKPTDITASNGVTLNNAANKNTNVIVDFSVGANTTVEYVDSSNVKFTFTSADGSASFTTTVTANANSGLDFKSADNQFYFYFSANAVSPKFSEITIDWERSVADDIADFQARYADVLVPTTSSAYLPMVRAALNEYESASAELQAGLAAEYAQLKENYTAIIVEAGVYATDFETGTDFWEQYADFTDKAGEPVVQDNFAVETLGSDRTGGISQNESGNILVADTTVTEDTYAPAEKTDDTCWAVNATMMLSPARVIWQGAKAADKNFASADFDLYVNVAGNTSGILVYYNYVDNDNFSFFRIKRGTGGLETVNIVVGRDESTGLRKRTFSSSTTIRPLNNWSVNANNWVHVRIAYDADDKAVLYVTGEPGDTYTLTSNDAVAKENRMFAIGSSNYNGVTVKAVIDNFSMILANDEMQEGVDFETKYADTLALNAERFAAYDAAEVDRMVSAYNSLTEAGQASLKPETVSAVAALQAARELWDTTSDATIAQSYQTIWGAKLTTETEKAWNVYNRLTAAQKALLAEEYSALVAAMQEKPQVTDDTVNINCVGDSITFGSGSTSVDTYSYPAQLQAKLGSDYVVSRNGIAGIAVVKDYTVASADEVELQMAGSTQWINSHKGTDDIIIIQLGTNDLSQVIGNGDKGTALYRAGIEKFIQSYLRLENSPLVIISNTPVSYSAIDRGYAHDVVAKINMEIADKYGLPCVDMHAYTYAYTDETVATHYAADRLHFTDTGYADMAEVFYNVIKALTPKFDTAEVTGFAFYENTVNSFLAPQLISATIRENADPAKQDIRFKSQFSLAVKTGTTIVEYGTIFTPYASGKTDLSKMVYDAQPKDNILIAKRTDVTENVAGETYYASLGGVEIPIAYIARSYVKFSDGSVYYSVNTTEDGNYEARKGVKDGYSCRSAISIAKAMTIFLAENDIDISEVGSYTDGQLTWNEGVTDNDGAAIFAFLTAHAGDIRDLVGE